MRLLTAAVLLLVFQAAISQDGILEAYPEVFTRAAREAKKVFVVFSSDYCGWFVLFDKYHASPGVKEILEKDFLFQLIVYCDEQY